MKIITICSRKGGSGKTTVTRSLATGLVHQKHRVLLIDADNQANLTDWFQCRESEDLSLVECSMPQLKRNKDALSEQFDFVLIDTPPSEEGIVYPMLEVADLVLIPCKASPDDLRSVGITAALAKRLNKPFLFVMTQVETRAGITKIVESTLQSIGQLAPSLRKYSVYIESSISGQTPMDLGRKSNAVEDIRALTDHVLKLCAL